MLIPEYKNNKMQISVMWTENIEGAKAPRYAKWLQGIQRRYRSIEYADRNGKKHKGYIRNSLQSNESFAVYVKELYGDGFYYFPITEEGETNGVYLLIIKEDTIMPGTDVIYDVDFFHKIDEERELTEYSKLNRKELGIEHFDEISATYKKNILLMQRKRNFQYLSIFFCMAVFAVILYFVTSIIISR